MISYSPNRARTVMSFVLFVAVFPFLCAAEENQDGGDIVGIYFDQTGDVSSVKTTEPWEPLEAWLVLKDVSSPGGVAGVGVYGLVDGPVAEFCWHSLIGAHIFTCLPEWILGATPPLAPGAAIPVVYMWFRVRSPNDVVRLYVQPPPATLEGFDGVTAIYVAEGSGAIVPLHPSSGSYDLPVAVVNGGITPTVPTTWGSLKGLFR